ncbi:MAG: hypothetical protein ACREDS_03680 [Limisphaerales bacterium]
MQKTIEEKICVEPTEADVLAEKFATGGTYDSAKARLTDALRQKAERLAKISPEAGEVVRESFAEAQAARQKAESEIEARLDVITGLEIGLSKLGELHLKKSKIELLRLTPEIESHLNRQALDTYMDFKETASVQTQSAIQSTLEELAIRRACSPAIPGAIEDLQSQIKSLQAEIVSEAKNNSIDLQKLLAFMVTETHRFPRFGQWRNCNAFENLS